MTLARTLHLPPFVAVAIEGHSFPIVWSIIGGFVLVAGAHALIWSIIGGFVLVAGAHALMRRPGFRSWR
jgi:hypothetical protein